jgi:hypothetical protein
LIEMGTTLKTFVVFLKIRSISSRDLYEVSGKKR